MQGGRRRGTHRLLEVGSSRYQTFCLPPLHSDSTGQVARDSVPRIKEFHGSGLLGSDATKPLHIIADSLCRRIKFLANVRL